MDRYEFEQLLMGYVDDELDAPDRDRLLAYVEKNDQARDELEAMQRLREVEQTMILKEPTEAAWKDFERGLTHKLVYRPLHVGGMLVCVAGLLLLMGWGWYELFGVLFREKEIPAVVRIGGAAVLSGLLAMGISVLIHRLVTLPRDRYHHEVEE